MASLILGILSMCLPIIVFSIPALFLALLGLNDIRRSRGRLQGRGIAIAGIVTAVFGTLLFIPLVLLLLIPVVAKTREAAERLQSKNNLNQIAAALSHFHNQNGMLPPAAAFDRQGRPLYSWRVLLLPYLEEEALYKQFKLDEPWDSPVNRPLLDQMPKVYAMGDSGSPRTHTHYQVFVGRGTAFELGPRIHIPDGFPDGAANTFLVVEAAEAAPWTKPQDLSFTSNGPLPKLGGLRGSGFNALFADGAVREVPHDADEATIRAMITRNGGETLPANDW